MNTIDYDAYKNDDGTYTSPRNGKVYKSQKAFIAHWHAKSKGGWHQVNNKLVECKYCFKELSVANIKRHESSCYLNPTNLTECKVCGKPVKNYKTSKGTCSYSCSNVYFNTLRNKDENLRYQALCFRYHGKKCLVCGEEKIVAAHHVNENHDDDRIENLVPLCPTHHQYVHSRYKDEVQPIIESYLESWKLTSGCSSAVE